MRFFLFAVFALTLLFGSDRLGQERVVRAAVGKDIYVQIDAPASTSEIEKGGFWLSVTYSTAELEPETIGFEIWQYDMTLASWVDVWTASHTPDTNVSGQRGGQFWVWIQSHNEFGEFDSGAHWFMVYSSLGGAAGVNLTVP